MEEGGAHVATPMFIHPVIGGGLCEPHPMSKKHGLPFMAPNLQQQQQINKSDDWNPMLWDCDGVKSEAEPLDTDSLRPGTTAAAMSVPCEPFSGNRDENTAAGNHAALDMCPDSVEKENDESLRLKLGGGGSGNLVVETVSRPNKRDCSGSPSSGGNYPMCQVDNCKKDFSYEVHDNAGKSMLGSFFQHCNRFDPFFAFGEGKRSCHHRRKRTQPDGSPQLVTSANHDHNVKENLDLVHLVTVLACAQGSISVKGSSFSSLPNEGQLIHILSKLMALPLAMDLIEKIPASGNTTSTTSRSEAYTLDDVEEKVEEKSIRYTSAEAERSDIMFSDSTQTGSKQVNGSTDRFVETLGTDATNNLVADNCHESQSVGVDCVQTGFNEEHDSVKLSTYVNAPLATESPSKPTSEGNEVPHSTVSNSIQIVFEKGDIPEKSADHSALKETETVDSSVAGENEDSRSIDMDCIRSESNQGYGTVSSADNNNAPPEAAIVNSISSDKSLILNIANFDVEKDCPDQGLESASSPDDSVTLVTETSNDQVPSEKCDSETEPMNGVQTGFDMGHELAQSTDHVKVVSYVHHADAPQEASDINSPLPDEREHYGSSSDGKHESSQPNSVRNGLYENAFADSMGSEIKFRNVPDETCESFPSISESLGAAENEVGNVVSLIVEKDSACVAHITEPESESKNSDVKNGENLTACPVSDEQSTDIADDLVSREICSKDPFCNCNLERVHSEEKIPTHKYGDACKSENSNGDTGCAKKSISSGNINAQCHVDDLLHVASDMDMESSGIGNSDLPTNEGVPKDDVALSECKVLNDCEHTGESGEKLVTEAMDIEHMVCQPTGESEAIPSAVSSTSLPEGSVSDLNALNGQNVGNEAMIRPFHFLFRVPRFDDTKHREQIQSAQLQVDEKTRHRDIVKFEMQKTRANCQVHSIEYEAAKAEERDARRLVRLKRQEIDSVQTVINRVKNAISVEDIDGRICNMEHMIEHETLPLKEEKHLIREIKQLKHIREQLSSNMGSQDEVQQALDQKDQIEERMKVLKKELYGLKDKVAKAQFAALEAGKKYEHETKKLAEVQAQFRQADDIRQAAYAHLQSMKKQLFDKNKHFRTYKDDLAASGGYAVKRDWEALYRLCTNQVELMMELWNKDDEFRNEYVKCNLRSTLRRLGTPDGRSLGPDEELPVFPKQASTRVAGLVTIPQKPSSSIKIPPQDHEKHVVTPSEVPDDKPTKVAEKWSRPAKTKKPAEPILPNDSEAVSDQGENEVTQMNEPLQTKKEEELVKKAEELRKNEAAEELKEQRRLEEIVKAKEAQERKKRNAEKAQIRADLRAQKEAEQKEKEREKKLRKKERRKAGVSEPPQDSNTSAETSSLSETSAESIREPEVKEGPAVVTKKPKKSSQFTKQNKTKSIPPPIRNKGKRRMQQWIWVILSAVVVIALFLLGNIGFFSNLGQRRSPRL